MDTRNMSERLSMSTQLRGDYCIGGDIVFRRTVEVDDIFLRRYEYSTQVKLCIKLLNSHDIFLFYNKICNPNCYELELRFGNSTSKDNMQSVASELKRKLFWVDYPPHLVRNSGYTELGKFVELSNIAEHLVTKGLLHQIEDIVNELVLEEEQRLLKKEARRRLGEIAQMKREQKQIAQIEYALERRKERY